jgi:hypothetical protein
MSAVVSRDIDSSWEEVHPELDPYVCSHSLEVMSCKIVEFFLERVLEGVIYKAV